MQYKNENGKLSSPFRHFELFGQTVFTCSRKSCIRSSWDNGSHFRIHLLTQKEIHLKKKERFE